MKSKIYQFDPAIYPFPLLVTKDFDEEEMKKTFLYVNAHEQLVECTDEFTANGVVTARVLCVADRETQHMYFMVLIFRPKTARNGIITHEAIHMANAYLQYLGVAPARAWDDEEYAYFGGWIANCVWSVRDGHPELMKGVLYGDSGESAETRAEG